MSIYSPKNIFNPGTRSSLSLIDDQNSSRHLNNTPPVPNKIPEYLQVGTGQSRREVTDRI